MPSTAMVHGTWPATGLPQQARFRQTKYSLQQTLHGAHKITLKRMNALTPPLPFLPIFPSPFSPFISLPLPSSYPHSLPPPISLLHFLPHPLSLTNSPPYSTRQFFFYIPPCLTTIDIVWSRPLCDRCRTVVRPLHDRCATIA